MIQPVSATKLQNIQNVQACSGVQNAQKPQTNASATAPQKQGATLGAMAANIKKAGAKNGGVTNFNGTKDNLLTYLCHQVRSGDLDVEKGAYTKVVKINDGTTYTVTIGKPNGRGKDVLNAAGNKKGASITLKDNAGGQPETLSISCHPEIYKSDNSYKREYDEMKKKYGEI